MYFRKSFCVFYFVDLLILIIKITKGRKFYFM